MTDLIQGISTSGDQDPNSVLAHLQRVQVPLLVNDKLFRTILAEAERSLPVWTLGPPKTIERSDDFEPWPLYDGPIPEISDDVIHKEDTDD